MRGFDFADVGDHKLCQERFASGMKKLKEIEGGVIADRMNVERYVKETASTIHEMFTAIGHTIEQKHVRVIAMITAANQGPVGGGVRHGSVCETYNGALSCPEPQGGERRQRHVQAMAPEVHYCT